jgi:hypothetical protein
MHTILVPDVAAAASGQPTSAKGAQRGIKQSTNEVRAGLGGSSHGSARGAAALQCRAAVSSWRLAADASR